ncbi:tetratricopeptide repeat protein [Pseudoalteromonas phenolica]|uniref:tetratricopeptide repeat protein n=1 Tax=Pseudoalteromonas phenolica TaxID=161398 RepID=UPI000FFE5C71|nr:tetratricopeptide repeat protein [Pseudoalteromonas phenolica]RXE94878.1 tetratricopeptide repeat protein [Pseudoalteromonas phenolica O-BC30]
MRLLIFLIRTLEKHHCYSKKIDPVKLKTDELIIEYHHLSILASLLLHEEQASEPSFALLFSMVESKSFQDKRFNILYNLGVWLRRGGYYSQSESALLCALRSANNAADKMKTLNSLGGIARHYGKNIQAQDYFQRTLEQAKKVENSKAIAISNNNLGVMAFEFNQIEKANGFFKVAYRNFQISQYESGELNSGINLLFTFALLEDHDMYNRALPRVKELVDKYNSDAKNAYFAWVNAFSEVQLSGYKHTTVQRGVLKQKFESIDEAGLQRLLQKYIAKPLEIEVALLPKKALGTKSLSIEARPWLKKAIECNF